MVITALAVPAILLPSQIVAQSFNAEEIVIQARSQSTPDSLWQQAEPLVRQALNRAFLGDPSRSTAKITVIVNYERQALPLFSVEVSRANWQQSFDIDPWITWAAPSFSVETLLGLGQPSTAIATGPAPLRVDDTDLLEDDPAFRDD